MAPLCSPLPGESLPVRLRRYALALEPFTGVDSVEAVVVALTDAAEAMEASYDSKQAAARLVVCSQCGHQVYSTVKAEA
jgi:hypothetical protein